MNRPIKRVALAALMMFLVLLVGVNYLQAGERVTQVEEDSVGQARGEPHSFSLAAAVGKASGVESGLVAVSEADAHASCSADGLEVGIEG